MEEVRERGHMYIHAHPRTGFLILAKVWSVGWGWEPLKLITSYCLHPVSSEVNVKTPTDLTGLGLIISHSIARYFNELKHCS